MAENEKPNKRKARVKKNDSKSDSKSTKKTTKKPATKKPATKKPATKKPATKKPATKKPATKKPATKKPATKNPSTKKVEMIKDVNTKTPLSKVEDKPLDKEVKEITNKMASKQKCCQKKGSESNNIFKRLYNWFKSGFTKQS